MLHVCRVFVVERYGPVSKYDGELDIHMFRCDSSNTNNVSINKKP
jgi:hypothetical protein